MITPSFFDCNVWTGQSDEHPTGGIDSPPALLEEMDRVGIDRALVYHISARTGNAKAGNELLLDELADYSRLEPAWVASLDAVSDYGSVGSFVDEMQSAGVKAVRMFPGEHDYRLPDREVEPLLTALEEIGAVVILDGISGIDAGFTREELADVCEKHQHPEFGRPELSVILTQTRTAMGPISRADDLVEAVQSVDNLYLGPDRFGIHEGMREFADLCGVDKIVFSTRMPHASGGAGLATVMLSSLTVDEQQQVAGENLTRLLGQNDIHWQEAEPAPVRQFKWPPYDLVDIHGHVKPDGPPGEIYADAEGIVRQMDRTGISLCAVSCLWGDEAGNDVAARAARRYPNRLVPYAVGNPNWEDPGGELERSFDDLGMKIIKIHPTSHDTLPTARSYEPIFEFANEREALVATHARCPDDERDEFLEVAKNYPDMTFMLYHAGRAWDRLDNFVQIAEECPNVLLEITFSYNVDGIIEALVDAVGAERVFFGTDIAARAPESQVGWATYARLDEPDRKLFLRDNALRLLDEMGALPELYQGEY